MAALSSIVTGNLPAPTGCFSNAAPELRDLNGLSGQVCQINVAPALADIKPCCKSGTDVHVQDDCTQYCATEEKDFRDCVAKLLQNPPVSQLGSLCQDVKEGASVSVPAGSSPVGGAQETGGPGEGAAVGDLGRYSVGLVAVAATVAVGCIGLL